MCAAAAIRLPAGAAANVLVFRRFGNAGSVDAQSVRLVSDAPSSAAQALEMIAVNTKKTHQ